MRKFLYFLSCDARHLQTRLERLAKKGLVLTDTDGLFTATFEETSRSEVRYLVVPFGNAKHAPQSDDFSCFGWTLLGGFNGMAIFLSMPCVQPDEQGLLKKLRQDGSVHPDRKMPYLLFAGLICLIGLLAWCMWHPGSNEAWYSTYFNLGIPVVGGVMAALAISYLAAWRSYPAAWVHGLTPPVALAGIFLLLLLRILDESEDHLFFVLLLAAVAAATVLGLWRRSRITAGICAGICLVVLCVGILCPNINQTVGAGKELHYETTNAPVLQLSDFDDDGELKGSAYQVNGTVLARKTSYWEFSDQGSISSEVTKCAMQCVADDVFARAFAQGDWTEETWGWSRNEGKTVLLRYRNQIALVTASEPIQEDQIKTIQQKLFA